MLTRMNAQRLFNSLLIRLGKGKEELKFQTSFLSASFVFYRSRKWLTDKINKEWIKSLKITVGTVSFIPNTQYKRWYSTLTALSRHKTLLAFCYFELKPVRLSQQIKIQERSTTHQDGHHQILEVIAKIGCMSTEQDKVALLQLLNWRYLVTTKRRKRRKRPKKITLHASET